MSTVAKKKQSSSLKTKSTKGMSKELSKELSKGLVKLRKWAGGKTPKPNKYNKRYLVAVIQHGGSSTERYLHVFDTMKEAEKYIKSANKATYDCDEPEKIFLTPKEAACKDLFAKAKAVWDTFASESSAPHIRGYPASRTQIAQLGQLVKEIEAALKYERSNREFRT